MRRAAATVIERDRLVNNVLDRMDDMQERISRLEVSLVADAGVSMPGLAAAPFVTAALDVNLSDERVLTAGDGIDVTDGGAGSTITVAVDVTDLLGSGLSESGNNIDLNWATPAISLGTAYAAGSSEQPIRADATLLAFDATLPADVATTAAVGVATVAARRDHVHVHPSGLGSDLHHTQIHALAGTGGLGTDHTVTGLTAGQYLRATGATTAAFQTIPAGDLPDHASRHEVGGADLVDHDLLTNFVADEHVAHSGVNLTAGNGLSGGGDISASRSFAVVPDDLITGGSAEFDGDQLDVDWNPSNYTPSTTPTEATDVDHLTAHLYGIDQALGGVGGNHQLLSATHTDTVASTVSRGSLIVGNATPAYAELALGASGTYLRSDGTDAAWGSIQAGDLPAHTHAGAGQGGQLDWDDVWGDAVHDHTSNAEGGTLSVGAISDLAYALPSLTLGTTNATGSANTVIRSDATILVFDAGIPNTIQPDDPGTAGSATVAARRDHEHAIVAAAPTTNLSVSMSNSEGSGTSFARNDHGHAITSSSNPGVAASILATDASGNLTVQDLTAAGAIYLADILYRSGDVDTYIDGNADQWNIYAGGVQFLTITETTQNTVVVNEGSADIDFRVESDNEEYALFVEGNTGAVGIGVSTPGASLTLSNNSALAWQSAAGGTSAPVGLTATSEDSLSIVTNNTDRIFVSYGGAVTINSTGADADFLVRADNQDFALFLESSSGTIYINETANSFMAGPGITINQGANDDEALAFKSSDVAHGMTTQLETDTYGKISKTEPDGGLKIVGAKDAGGANSYAVLIQGFQGEAANTGKTTGSNGVIAFQSYVQSGTTVGNCGSDANLLSIANGGTTRFIFDAEGSAHSDVEWTTFDEHDDLALLARLERTLLARSFGGWIDENRAELEKLDIAHFDDQPGHAMVNWTKLNMLLIGALRQVSTRLALLEA